jgi:1,4-alpha-glucan branching enzyme
MVVLNFADRSYQSYNLGFPKPGNWSVRFNSDWQGYSDDFGNFLGYNTQATKPARGKTDGMVWAANVGIGPYSALILSQ